MNSPIRTKKPIIHDLFSGAGGTTTGIIQACEILGLNPEMTAINHWNMAVDSHTANHPEVKHYCQSLGVVHPLDVQPEGVIDVLVASPECIHFTKARQARPMSAQSRAGAQEVAHWASILMPRIIIVENVEEFQDWGPLNRQTMRPIESKKGQLFQAWINGLKATGYKVDYRTLQSEHYGDATKRKRLFIIATRGKLKPIWPLPTHGNELELEENTQSMFSRNMKKWRIGRDIIDPTRKSTSIFEKPKALNTVRRIFHGTKRFKDNHMTILRKNNTGTSLESPCPTITAGGKHLGYSEPLISKTESVSRAQSMVNLKGQNSCDVSKPLLTQTSMRHLAATHVQIDNPNDVSPENSETVFQVGIALESIINAHYTKKCPTILLEPGTPIPLSKIEKKQIKAIKSANPGVEKIILLVKTAPIIVIQGMKFTFDILFRMLANDELARAQGFPPSYTFAGLDKDVTKQIGNSVPPGLARAIFLANWTQNADLSDHTDQIENMNAEWQAEWDEAQQPKVEPVAA
jgi:site-specific DNA-cytosine methylase